MGSLWDLDQSLFRTIHIGWHAAWLDPIFFVITSTGLGYVQAILSLGFLPWRRIREKGSFLAAFEDGVPLTIPILASFVISGLVTSVLKSEITRERPSNYGWAHPQEFVHDRSFPSGHTTTSFAIAFTLFFLTRRSRPWIGWAALGWAALVGLSRVYRGVHWPSDVLAGLALGLACGSLVALFFPSPEPTATSPLPSSAESP